jgi:hypothetical protein
MKLESLTADEVYRSDYPEDARSMAYAIYRCLYDAGRTQRKRNCNALDDRIKLTCHSPNYKP